MASVSKMIKVEKWGLSAVIVVLLVTLPFILPEYWVYTSTDIMAYCIFALGLNIVLGYGGMIAFGHAGFYGAGAYVLALLLKKTNVPFWAALLLAPLLPTLFGVIIGFFSIRRRAFYFAVITLAFSELIWAIIIKWYTMTGGENGITGISIPSIISTTNSLYLFTLAVTSVCVFTIYRIIDSPFGRTLRAMRENAQRMEFTGVNLDKQRLIAFTISAFFASIGGTMHAIVTRCAFPDLADWPKSGEVVITCMLGGIHTFFGPVVGVALLFFMNSIVGRFTQYWPSVLGLLFILIVFFLPNGVVGYIQESKLAGWIKRIGRLG